MTKQSRGGACPTWRLVALIPVDKAPVLLRTAHASDGEPMQTRIPGGHGLRVAYFRETWRLAHPSLPMPAYLGPQALRSPQIKELEAYDWKVVCWWLS